MHIRTRHVLWVGLLISALAASVVAVQTRGLATIAVAVALVLLLLASVVRQFQRDPVWCFQVASGAGLIAALIVGAIALEEPSARARALVWALSLGAATACAGYYGWIRKVDDRIKNALFERFDRSQIAEVEGVQLAMSLAPAASSEADGCVAVYLQNCVDAVRNVRLRLEAQTAGFVARKSEAELPAVDPFTLGPGESARITLPFRWGRARPIQAPHPNAPERSASSDH